MRLFFTQANERHVTRRAAQGELKLDPAKLREDVLPSKIRLQEIFPVRHRRWNMCSKDRPWLGMEPEGMLAFPFFSLEQQTLHSQTHVVHPQQFFLVCCRSYQFLNNSPLRHQELSATDGNLLSGSFGRRTQSGGDWAGPPSSTQHDPARVLQTRTDVRKNRPEDVAEDQPRIVAKTSTYKPDTKH